jgi:hypothetical protein
MTGPELYRESVSLAHDDPGCACERTCCIHEQVQLQRAQVLATAALAAATALGHLLEGGPLGADRYAWICAASEHPGQQRRIGEANAEFEEAQR